MTPDDLRAATLGIAPQAPSPTNLGSENAGVIGNFHAGGAGMPVMKSMVGADSYNINAQQENDEAAKQALKDASDPSKYQVIPKPDGGYGFVDPTGKEISAYDYSRATGTALNKLLSDSQNPIDQGFIQDYTNLQDYLGAWINGDTETVDAMQSENPALKKIKSPQELTALFRQHYPTVFGGTGSGNQPVDKTFIPNASVSANKYAGGAGIGQ